MDSSKVGLIAKYYIPYLNCLQISGLLQVFPMLISWPIQLFMFNPMLFLKYYCDCSRENSFCLRNVTTVAAD
jgi:hypothetical protein